MGSTATAQGPGRFPREVERDRPERQGFHAVQYYDERVGDQHRRDFIRGGHVNIGVIFGGQNDRRGSDSYPDGYPDRYPDRGCDDCGYGRSNDDWYREAAKRRAEWEREEAKRYYEQQREAEKRFREQEREAWKRQRESEREHVKALREADRERFEAWRGN